MCGRYALTSSPETLARRFDADPGDYAPTYNAAPSQSLPVLTDADPGSFRAYQWGFVPAWADDASPGPINARIETATEKPTFRDAVASRRCLVPATGFYEWRETSGTKRPYYFSRPDGDPFAMAGIWATYDPETTQTGLGDFADGDTGTHETDPVRSFAILTREASGVVADYHHRESVLLTREEEAGWLAGDDLAAFDRENLFPLDVHPVSRAVNDPAVDRPDLVEPA